MPEVISGSGLRQVSLKESDDKLRSSWGEALRRRVYIKSETKYLIQRVSDAIPWNRSTNDVIQK